MKIPMPSPTGMNRAGLFINRPRVGAAYDALPESGLEEEKEAERLSKDAAGALHEFLKGKLSEEDLREFCRMAGIDDPALSMDQARRRFRMALDGRLGDEMQRLARSDRFSVAAKMQMFGKAKPAHPGFAERFPGAAKINTSW
jgi:hypothetical protein